MFDTYLLPLIGGLLIGFAAGLLLLFNGKIFGVSGIIGGVISPQKGETAWKISALSGLVLAGLLMGLFGFEVFSSLPAPPMFILVVSGLLVGFGSRLGNGCTSGHGVCGVARFSPRSIAATALFTVAGILSVLLIRNFGW
jgi:uncharacterized membrane protein YedE/YeeE